MKNNEIIEIKQLPVIVEQLQVIKEEVTKKVTEILSLDCTEDTVGEIKKARADMRADLNFWEEKRKEVKNAIMTPYNQFEVVYKECISDIFKAADTELKGKIDAVENELKERTRAEVEEYFAEYLASKNIDFVTFENANINVTLSASKKSLKEKAKAFIDRICEDLNLIETQEHKDEILYEYKRFLNVSLAITTVATRYKVIEAEKAKEAERKAREEAEKAAAEKVELVVETLTPPTVEEPIEVEPTLTLRFTVKGTRTQLRALKEFLKTNNYDFE